MKIGKVCAFICITAILATSFGCSGKQPVRTESQTTASAAVSIPAENASSQIKNDTIKSSLLEKDMRINVYLPKGYSKTEKYPVLYMFHGFGGHEDLWQAYGLTTKADELIENKKIPPMIIAMPAIENSYGINSSEVPVRDSHGYDLGMYEDYICKEVIGYIDSTYSTDPSRESRYIGGVSMGGYVALHLAFAHADLFSKAGGHSPAIWHGTAQENESLTVPWLYPNDGLRRERDPLILAKEKDLSKVKVYLDCGTEDSYKFYEGCELLYNTLKEKGVRAEYHTAPGGHEDPYWKANIENYLMFYASK